MRHAEWSSSLKIVYQDGPVFFLSFRHALFAPALDARIVRRPAAGHVLPLRDELLDCVYKNGRNEVCGLVESLAGLPDHEGRTPVAVGSHDLLRPGVPGTLRSTMSP